MTNASVPIARSTDPVTSDRAAEKQQKHLSKLQTIVYQIIKHREGLTDSELCDFYMAHSLAYEWPTVRFETPRKRRSDLSNRGLLVDSGETRVNPYGSPEVVWTVTA